MTIKEQDIVLVKKDEEGNQILLLPATRVENVERAVRTINKLAPDSEGNVAVTTVENANKASQDAQGNDIPSTYVSKKELTEKVNEINQTVTEGLEGKEAKGACLPRRDVTILGGYVNIMSVNEKGIAQVLRSDPGAEYAGVDIPSETTNWDLGAVFSLRTLDSQKEAGYFHIRTGNSGNGAKFFRGCPDGSLSWDGQEIPRIGALERQNFQLGGNGAKYTAPFTGKMCIAGAASNSLGNVEIINDYTSDHHASSTGSGVGWIRTQVYVRKGDVITVYYYNFEKNEAYWVRS